MPTKIAYKVENGVIINSTVVDADAPLEEGFIARDYDLYIGAIESFGDFYPPGTTQERIDNLKNANIQNANILIDKTQESNALLQNEMTSLTSQLELLPENDETKVDLQNAIVTKQNELEKNNRYISYLNDYKTNLVNPVFQLIKNKEEI